ncbi:PEP-CTERM sorting domain-containing protein [Ferrovum myxofaciens]|uniref:PEP-CTERM sorting domain-containing protein n=2 Tax=root TaxID=1 RepID=A0A9E6SYA8_9PROT|nr:PEP-CTERM sorting domain-containing protein [Ferrovum myxofaciens]QWY75568.1 MAG: PEP-CTERM sorting domain-containing protein [Ferrovum myxofaciens]QWY78308.1 MAG: PEP-CTERM sorting domain-containing protein [Ferrovum myxofaciens]
MEVPSYGVELTATNGSGSNSFYTDYGPNSTAGSIPTVYGPNWTGSVNVLTGQISAGTSYLSGDLLGSDQTLVEGWNTWTFHGPTGSSINPVFSMTGNFSSTGVVGPISGSFGTGLVCLGLSIGGCNQNAQYSTSTPNFNVGLQLSNIANNDSILLSYSLTTTAPSSGTSALFDPGTGFNNLPIGWTATGAAGSSAVVPEPSTVLLFLTGLAGIGLFGFTQRRSVSYV